MSAPDTPPPGSPSGAHGKAAGERAGAHGLAFFAMAVIATTFPVGDLIADSGDPAVLMFIRFAMASVLFTPIMIWRYGLHWPGFGALARYGVVAAAAVGFFWTMFEALKTTDSLNTSAISTTIPAFTALFAAILVRERMGWRRLVALGIGMLGALWVIFRGDPERLVTLDLSYGDWLFFPGCASMGLYAALIRRMHRGEPVLVMSFWFTIMTAFWLLIIANVKIVDIDWAAVDGAVLGGLAWLAVGPSITTFFLVQMTTLKIGATRVQAYTYFIPALVLLMDWALGRGLPSLMTLPGIAIVIAASLLIQRGVIYEGRQSAAK